MSSTSPKARGLLSRFIRQKPPRGNDSEIPPGSSDPPCVDKEVVRECPEVSSSNSSAYLPPFPSSSDFPRLLEENIFKHDLSPEIESQLLEKFKLLHPPAHSPLLGHTASPLPHLDEVTHYLLNWCITGDVTSPQGRSASITGLLTSSALARVLQDHLVDAAIITTFQTFILSTTLLHTGWHDHRPQPQRLSPAELQLISHVTGSSLLQHHLPRLLAAAGDGDDGETPLTSEASKATRQATISVVLGTILGVIYTTFPHSTWMTTEQKPGGPPPPHPSLAPVQDSAITKNPTITTLHGPSPSPSEPVGTGPRSISILIPPSGGPFQHSPTQWLAAKERLRLVLARELVRLARPLGLIPDAKTETAVVEGLTMMTTTTRRRWDGCGQQWVWGTVLIPTPAPTPAPAPPPPPASMTTTMIPTTTPFPPPPPLSSSYYYNYEGSSRDGGGRRRNGDDGQDDNKSSSYMDGPAGTFHPTPQAVMVGRPEVLNPHFPRPDPSDGRKRRSMILVGPWNDCQMYARMRVVGESGRPSMMA